MKCIKGSCKYSHYKIIYHILCRTTILKPHLKIYNNKLPYFSLFVTSYLFSACPLIPCYIRVPHPQSLHNIRVTVHLHIFITIKDPSISIISKHVFSPLIITYTYSHSQTFSSYFFPYPFSP